MLPARRRKPRREMRIRCPGHLAWVRKFHCCVRGCKGEPVEAAHVRGSGDGGMGLKPGDNWVISLCREHHAEQHRVGERAFAARYGLDLEELARRFWRASPHRTRMERKPA